MENRYYVVDPAGSTLKRGQLFTQWEYEALLDRQRRGEYVGVVVEELPSDWKTNPSVRWVRELHHYPEPHEVGEMMLPFVPHTHGSPPDGDRGEWEARDNRWRQDNLEAVVGYERVRELLDKARPVAKAFKQRIEDFEGYTGQDPPHVHYTGLLKGLNLLGVDVTLCEFRIMVDYKGTTTEVFSYNIDAEGSIDPTSLDVPHAEFLDTWVPFFRYEYNIEDPPEFPFGEDWLNNLAYWCWVFPQVQNEKGASKEQLESIMLMRHSKYLEQDAAAYYKLLVHLPNGGSMIYYAGGKPSDLMAKFGKGTKIISRMGDMGDE